MQNVTTAKYNLGIQQGASFAKSLQVLYGESNAPFDLTGYTVDAQIRTDYAAPSASADFTCVISEPPTSGTIQLELSPSQSLSLTGSCYLYDVRFTTGSEVLYPIEGKVTVSRVVTR